MVDTELGLLPKDWKLQPLGDLLYIKGRIGWKGLKKSEYLDKGYAIINGEQIKNDEVNWSSVGRIPKERYLESPEIMLKKDDILMTKDGTIGKIAYVNELPEEATVASGVFVIRRNSQLLNQKYLYNFFSSHYFKWLIKSRVEGSVIPHLYQRDFQEMLIPLPSYDEQVEIAATLNSLSEKIKLLQQQNTTLETIAQTIFKEWFGKYQLGDKLPDGWRVGKLGDLIEKTIDNRGKTPPLSSDESHLMLETYQMSAKTPFPNFAQHNKKKYVSSDLYSNWFRSGHPKYLDILFATVGNGIPNWCFMPKNNDQYCIAQNLVAFRAKSDISGVYLKYFFDTRNFKSLCNGIIITTAQPSIKLSHLRLLDIIIPKQELISTFNSTIEPMVDLIYNNAVQIQSLTKTRDTLLPKLMSGQVRVEI
ncbi:MAG: restriction endonuclease subunit S [Maribacter arcticus]|uniref:restriction endonuclease subunit S n=1 Tax=Maribacter arcticus TaxID=561365 RepID=UPI00300196D9